MKTRFHLSFSVLRRKVLKIWRKPKLLHDGYGQMNHRMLMKTRIIDKKENIIRMVLYGCCVLVLCYIVTILHTLVRDDILVFTSNESKVCVPIIMYHQVKNSGLGKDVITPSEFESDLKYLKEHNYNTVTMEDLIKFVYEDVSLPENPIILSFDDGYYSTYKYVYPLLQAYDMKIVMSIIGKSTEDYSRVNDTNVEHAHLSWDHIIEMANSGHVEVQNHSYNLHKISGKRYGSGQIKGESIEDYSTVLSDDLQNLQQKVEEMIGKKPTTYTYPYGKYNNNTDVILEENGFQCSLSVKFGVNLLSKDRPDKLFGMKRICRAHGEGIGKLIKDGMETLRFSSE